VKLWYSPNSPYARKCVVIAEERGLSGAMEVVAVNPMEEGALRKDNPLSKVPALVLDDGTALYDSTVIAEYLDSIGKTGAALYPAGGKARWIALRRLSLADGMLDVLLLRRYAATKTLGMDAGDWVKRWTTATNAALDEMEKEVAGGMPQWDIGAVGFACALGYLDLRFASEDWRKGRPKLAAWFETQAKRPSMIKSKPPG
jgi:glutathione S-transferase